MSRSRWIFEPMGAKHQKLLVGNNGPGQVPSRVHATFLQPSLRYRETIRRVSIFSYKNQILVMKPLNLRANGGKTPKTTPGQQCAWQVPSRPHATFFKPSLRYRETIRRVSIFSKQKLKTCHETVEFTSQTGQNTKNYSWATMSLASAFTHTCDISSALAPLSRKNSLSQHFFLQKSKACHETVEFTSQWGQTLKTTHGQQCHWQVPSRPHATFLQP